METIICCDHLLQQNSSKFLKTKVFTEKCFLHIYFLLKFYYLENVDTSASKLLPLSATKYPKTLLLRTVFFILLEWKILFCKTHTDIIINLIIFYTKILLKARTVNSYKCFFGNYRNHQKSFHHILQQSTMKFWYTVIKKLFKIWKKLMHHHAGQN